MSSRRRGGNTGNSSPVVTRTYQLRDRTRSKGDLDAYGRQNIKNAGKVKKDGTAEQNVKNQASRRNARQVRPDTDDYSDDGSNYSGSSRSEISEDDDYLTTTSRSSARNQPFSPRQPSTYTDDDFVRPPIRSIDGSTVRPPSSARQPTDSTIGDKDEINYYKEETWRDDAKETVQRQQKPKDQFNKTTGYKEDIRTLRSTNRSEDRFYHHRSQQIPPEIAKFPAAQPTTRGHFSDDDEERIVRHQQKPAMYPRSVEGEKMNHYPGNSAEQKANTVKKPLAKSIGIAGTCMKYLVLAFLVLLVGSMAALYISPMSLLELTGQVKSVYEPQVKKDLKEDFENLTSIFPSQSPLMWSRSKRILELHLKNWKGNAEPAIILLTGARDAEHALLCLGTRLADVYSSSLSGSSMLISGSDWASRSNEEVKEYIDESLSAGFQATTRAAVLHRLELLPAGSLLILYKYCDHESAVFKDVTLLLTVLLDDATLERNMSLTELEEKVRAFLIENLIDSTARASHDGMDEDKFSGVWSRISHVVLPVFPEENITEKCVMKEN